MSSPEPRLADGPTAPAGVVIVNDSQVARAVTAAVLQADGGFRLLGQATGGLTGVELVCRLRPQLVLLDLHMPDIDGVEVTRRVMASCPTRILISSATIRSNSAYLFDALNQGALDYTHTPTLKARPGEAVTRADLLAAGAGLLRKMRTVLSLSAGAGVVVRATASRPAPRAPALEPRPPKTVAERRAIRFVAVGSSTGGPSALATLFGNLPRGLPAVYLVSQHIDAEFTEGLALWLAEETGHPVSVARPNEIPIPGHVYLASGGRRNLVLTPGGRLSYEAAGDAVYSPNINRLFATVAAAAPLPTPATQPEHARTSAPICGVILTGLGDDGTEGLALIKSAGGRVLVQDPATAVVDGMPGAPIRRGILTHGHALPDLARLIARWIEETG